ncbi:MAG: hypothetical protein P8171_14010 [Candidatus Thiodiazotropha sp.]
MLQIAGSLLLVLFLSGWCAEGYGWDTLDSESESALKLIPDRVNRRAVYQACSIDDWSNRDYER